MTHSKSGRGNARGKRERVCPRCGYRGYRRANKRCPGCKTPLALHKGIWVAVGDDQTERSPAKIILDELEGLVRRETGNNKLRIYPRDIDDFSFLRELGYAQRILKMAGYDLELVLQGLRILYARFIHSDRPRTSLYYFSGVEMRVVLQEIERCDKERGAQVRLDQDTAPFTSNSSFEIVPAL